jgi:hypothetical protein
VRRVTLGRRSPGPTPRRSTVTNPGAFNPRKTRSSSKLRHAASLSPPMLRTASSTFCPSRRMDHAAAALRDCRDGSCLVGAGAAPTLAAAPVELDL